MMRRFILTFSAVMFSAPLLARAGGEETIEAIGPYFPIFIVEKSENPENVLVAYTKLSPDCRFVDDASDTSKPLLDFHWKMNRETYKQVHILIKSGIRDRLALVTSRPNERSKFSVRLNDLSELKHDLVRPLLNVTATRATTGGSCDVRSYITLGASDRSRRVELSSLYVESKKTFLPPFRKVMAVTLNGIDAVTGANVSRVYSAP